MCRSSPSTRTGRSGRSTCLGLSFSTELGYTNMLTALDLAGIPLHAADRDDEPPDRHRRRARRVQPRADRRLHRRGVARRRRAGGAHGHRHRPGARRARARRADARGCWTSWRAAASSTCRRSTTSTYLPDGRIQRVAPNRPGVPWRVGKHTVMDLDQWPYPKAPLVPAGRERPRADERGDLPRLHPRLPVLPGRHDHPPGPRTEHRTIGEMVDNGLRRTGHEEVGLLSLSSADHSEIAAIAKGLADSYEGTETGLSPAQHPRRRVQHRARQRALPQRPAQRS